MFKRQGLFYWEKGYSVRSDSNRSQWSPSIAHYIQRVIARIGREKPIYLAEYNRLCPILAERFAAGRGRHTVERALSMIGDCRVYGRFLLIDGCPMFEAVDQSLLDADGPVSRFDDFYICPECNKRRRKKTDPAKKEYFSDRFSWGKAPCTSYSGVCCKTCRAKLRKMTRESQQMADIRRLSRKLLEETKHVTH